MKKIYPEYNRVIKIIGRQEFDNSKEYVLSNYTVMQDTDDGTLVFNTLTKQMILLENDEQITPNDFFVTNWFYIEKTIDQYDFYKSFIKEYDKRYPLEHSDIVSDFVILTTTGCNARCGYCYEKGLEVTAMSEKTALDIGNWIMKKSGDAEIGISWFGGEPLTNSKVISVICQTLKDNGRKYKSSMVSNGYLLDTIDIDTMKNLWNLKRVQITLDGTENEYNRIKAFLYKNGSAFKKVISNIDYLLANDITVSVRMNISTENYSDLNKLVDYLHEKYSTNKNFYLYGHVIVNDSNINLPKEDNQIMYESLKKLHSKIIEQNFNELRDLSSIVGLRRNHCMSDTGGGLVINPKGELTVCEHFVSGDEVFGTIYDDEYNQEIIESWKEYDEDVEACKSCAYRPMCCLLKKCAGESKCDESFIDYNMFIIKQGMIALYNHYLEDVKLGHDYYNVPVCNVNVEEVQGTVTYLYQ